MKGIFDTSDNSHWLSKIYQSLSKAVYSRTDTTATGTTSLSGGFEFLTIRLPESVSGTITIAGIPYTSTSNGKLIEFPKEFSGSDISVVAGANTIYVTRSK